MLWICFSKKKKKKRGKKERKKCYGYNLFLTTNVTIIKVVDCIMWTQLILTNPPPTIDHISCL